MSQPVNNPKVLILCSPEPWFQIHIREFINLFHVSVVIKILKSCIHFGIEKEVRIRNCQKKKGPLNNFKGLLTLFTLSEV